MEMLHEDLGAINQDLAGIKIVVKGEEYYFEDFHLDFERHPPVAEGYILQLRMWVSAWRFEKVKNHDGSEVWRKSKYGFRPCDISFVADKTITQPGDGK